MCVAMLKRRYMHACVCSYVEKEVHACMCVCVASIPCCKEGRKAAWYTPFAHASESILVIVNCSIFISIH